MKALILLLALAAGPGLNAQKPVDQLFETSESGTSDQVRLEGTGVVYHRVTWYVSGYLEHCEINLEESADGIAWTTLGNYYFCKRNGQSSVVKAVVNRIRIRVNNLLQHPDISGSLSVKYFGYQNDPSCPCSAEAVKGF